MENHNTDLIGCAVATRALVNGSDAMTGIATDMMTDVMEVIHITHTIQIQNSAMASEGLSTDKFLKYPCYS